MDFKAFSKAVHTRYELLAQGELFVAEIDNIFDSYLAAFPQGTDPMFRVRTQHDCQCCKQFICKLGCLVSIGPEGQTHSVWDDLQLEHPYDSVAARLSEIVRQAPIRTVFRTKERQYGNEYSYDTKTNERWDHFHGVVGTKHLFSDPETKRGEREAIAQVLRRGLKELNTSDLESVLELIDSNAIYRGTEHRSAVVGFLKLKKAYDGNENFIWSHLDDRSASFRNTVIGTLLVDLADGKALEDAVRIFEAKVAPQNYKRTTALITPRMVDEAVEKLQELGLEGAIHRRFARLSDVSVNDVLFVDNSVKDVMKAGSIKELLQKEIVVKAVDPAKAAPISIGDFLSDVLPGSKKLEVMLENRHAGNFVSLTGGDGPERLFKWNNNFAWSYDGEVTDSVKQRVKKAGGNINALLRVSLSWFNYDDLDLHCVTPDKYHIFYANKTDGIRGQILDVDMNAGGRKQSRAPVENMAFQSLKDGVYKFYVNNYVTVENVDKGFDIEVEFAGVTHQYHHPKAVHGSSSVNCFNVHVKNGKMVDIEVTGELSGDANSSEKWGVKTEQLVPVTIACTSPNYWDGQKIGQQHWFFMLKGCKNPDPVRGIYNEFLRSDLEKHRKVFEVLGSKTKCPPTDDQISGVGFSSARGDAVTVVVDGRRSYNINF